jgi:hypothetical protein
MVSNDMYVPSPSPKQLAIELEFEKLSSKTEMFYRIFYIDPDQSRFDAMHNRFDIILSEFFKCPFLYYIFF